MRKEDEAWVYFIFLVAVLVIAQLATNVSPLTGYAGKGLLEISDLECSWDGQQYKLCADVAAVLQNNEYLKIWVPGVSGLKEVQAVYDVKERYCTDAGTKDGTKVFNVAKYNSKRLVETLYGTSVVCRAEKTTETIARKYFLLATRTYGRDKGEGILELKLPDNIEFCDVSGAYRIREDSITSVRGDCHNAKGSFVAKLHETGEQYGIEIPELFFWSGLSKGTDIPPEREYGGVIASLRFCDPLYYQSEPPRSEVKIIGDIKQNILEWSFVNLAQPDSMMDISMEFQCSIKKKESSRVFPLIKVTETIADEHVGDEISLDSTVDEAEPFVVGPIEEIPSKAEPVGLFGRIAKFFRNIFF